MTGRDREGDTVAVLAPSVYVSITIELAGDGGDDIHLHAGGQGIWVSRMLRLLGEAPTVCAPVGGEPGRALRGLVRDWGIRLRGVETLAPTPSYVHDRRSGDRVELARSRSVLLDRHESDELYHRILELALRAGTCVVTAPRAESNLPPGFFERLAADLAAAKVAVVGDLHGDALDAFLANGPIDLLKVAMSDLVEDGVVAEDRARDEDAAAAAAAELAARGAEAVVVSRGDQPVIARFGAGLFRTSGPRFEAVDTTGSGDSMTAGLAAGLVGGRDAEDMLRLAWAAGAANVTRRGLGSASPGLIEELEQLATVERMGTA